jgi:hypothetical protein
MEADAISVIAALAGAIGSFLQKRGEEVSEVAARAAKRA